MLDSEYIALTNNMMKLYPDGTLKVLGQINDATGQTSEEQAAYDGIQEFKYPSQIPNPQNSKKTYFMMGTAYVIDENNDLWVWGDNTANKLGLGNSYKVTVPIKINDYIKVDGESIKIKNVWCGRYNTWILDTENRVWAAGANTSGGLGQGNYDVYNNYVNVIQLDGSKIKEIQPSIIQNTTFVIYNDGTVYASGSNNMNIFGNGQSYISYSSFIKLDNFNGAKKILTGSNTSLLLKENGELYGCGSNSSNQLGLGVSNDFNNNLVLIANNVQDVVYTLNSNYDDSIKIENINNDISYGTIMYKDNNGNVYLSGIPKVTSDGTITYLPFKKIENLQDNNLSLLSSGLIFSNGKLYKYSYDELNDSLMAVQYAEKYDNISIPYFDNLYENQRNNMKVFSVNGKIYIDSAPDITAIGKRVRCSLKQIFSDAIFVQGCNDYTISIVDNNNDIWEGITYKNVQLSNAKKIISSATAKYILKNDGTLYAKGNLYTGGWGSITPKYDYTQITKDGTNIFDNIKDIYTSNVGLSAIFITDDNKMYWMGSDVNIILPGGSSLNSGDLEAGIYGKITAYPKQVINEKLNSILPKAKDIEYDINWVNDPSQLMYILTTDGELYVIGNNANTTGLQHSNTDFEKITSFGLNKVKSVKVYQNYTFALLENGEVYAWGYNTYGQFGDGYEIGKCYTIPQKLDLPNNIIKIEVGEGFSIFAGSAGEVYGAGRNEYGQLGNGNNISTPTFVRCTELEK